MGMRADKLVYQLIANIFSTTLRKLTMKNTTKRWLFIVPALTWVPVAFADYKTDIGYTDLQNLLGSNTPTGANVKITQVEASLVGSTDATYPIYAPDITDAQFSGKTFSFPGTASFSPSGHASGVGSLLYGNNAIASGITNITSYEANGWLSSIATNVISAPVNGSRIANHSWVGNGGTAADTGIILRVADREVQLNEFIQVVGMSNGPGSNPLLGSAYNVIAVGRTDGGQDFGSDAVSGDAFYVAGRARPDVVAPQTTTSSATPIVSAVAALLVETGHTGATTLSKSSTNIAGVGTVYNADRAETIKAALMAGADRATNNGITVANITDYRSAGHQTANGLDDRFGAGQVNALHSYQIIAAGEQNSQEDGGVNAGAIAQNGFDYDASFGGASESNKTATYKFSASADSNLSASLVWNIGVANNGNLTTTLHNLNLELFDETTQTTSAFSNSTLDNTENIWANLVTGHNYQLLVKSGEAGNFSWDYSLAWHTGDINTAPVPLPGALYLFGSAIAGLGFAGRRRT